jgi:diadenosine tetraphosphate (Ap4A) HIT family hydrolase
MSHPTFPTSHILFLFFKGHLVTSVGDDAYLTLAKGPLVPNHVLVVPITHRANSLELSDGEAAELERYVGSLRRCFASAGKEMILFERYMGNSQFEHLHLQCVPLSAQEAAGVSQKIPFVPICHIPISPPHITGCASS